jgi:hypothetical protein
VASPEKISDAIRLIGCAWRKTIFHYFTAFLLQFNETCIYDGYIRLPSAVIRSGAAHRKYVHVRGSRAHHVGLHLTAQVALFGSLVLKFFGRE